MKKIVAFVGIFIATFVPNMSRTAELTDAEEQMVEDQVKTLKTLNLNIHTADTVFKKVKKDWNNWTNRDESKKWQPSGEQSSDVNCTETVLPHTKASEGQLTPLMYAYDLVNLRKNSYFFKKNSVFRGSDLFKNKYNLKKQTPLKFCQRTCRLWMLDKPANCDEVKECDRYCSCCFENQECMDPDAQEGTEQTDLNIVPEEKKSEYEIQKETLEDAIAAVFPKATLLDPYEEEKKCESAMIFFNPGAVKGCDKAWKKLSKDLRKDLKTGMKGNNERRRENLFWVRINVLKKLDWPIPKINGKEITLDKWRDSEGKPIKSYAKKWTW